LLFIKTLNNNKKICAVINNKDMLTHIPINVTSLSTRKEKYDQTIFSVSSLHNICDIYKNIINEIGGENGGKNMSKRCLAKVRFNQCRSSKKTIYSGI
jgi:hypothetical protein